MIAILAITDGRLDYLRESIASLEANISGPIIEKWMYDDSGDRQHRSQIAEEFPEWTHFNGGERQGFAGAIRTSWDMLRRESIAQHVVHWEADFTFERPVDLTRLVGVLAKRPNLVQLAFRRQPWNDEEKAAGGIVELRPDEFVTHLDRDDNVWLEHDLFFTTNPSLYRRNLIEQFHWPAGSESEGRFGIELRRGGYRFGYWGPREDPPWVRHIGDQRVGKGY